jgi:secreted Zn-dependent insulinase-like peptidase
MRAWQNRKLQPPYQYLSNTLRNVLYTPSWTEDDMLAVAAELSLDDLEQYRRAFLGKLRIDVLAYGNITAEQTTGLKSLLEPLLSRVEGTVVLPGVDVVALPTPGRWHYPLTLEHSDAAIAYYVQGASDTNQQRVLMGLTGQIIRTPYYHSLRTEQQFGYVVYAATTVFERMPGLTFIVQSPVADAATLLAASDKLLQDFEQTAQAMTVPEFEQHKEALKSLINRPHKNIAHEAGFFWDQILQHYLGFDRREQLTLALDQIEQEQWRRFYRDNFLPLPARSLIVTQAGDHQAGPDAWKDSRLIKDVESFRQAQQQRPYP